MRFFSLFLTLCTFLMGLTSQASAAAYGSSIMNISNLRLQYWNGSIWANATETQASVSSTFTSQSSATLGPLQQSSGLRFNFNAPQSFVSPTQVAPSQQTVLPLAGFGPSTPYSFARGDTLGSGSTIVDGTVSTSTLAELNSLGSVSGEANGNLVNTNTFAVYVNDEGQYRLGFTANLAMQTSGDGYAANSFGITAIQSQTNGSTVGLPTDDAEWNQTLERLNRTLNVPGTVSESGDFFTAAVTLQSGPIAVFTVSQNSTAGANNVVPEPSSIAIFGLMSVGSLAALRRRRAGERKSAEA